MYIYDSVNLKGHINAEEGVLSHTILSYNQCLNIHVSYTDRKVFSRVTRISSLYYHTGSYNDGNSHIVWHKKIKVFNCNSKLNMIQTLKCISITTHNNIIKTSHITHGKSLENILKSGYHSLLEVKQTVVEE